MNLSKKLLYPLLLLSLCTSGCKKEEKTAENHIDEFIIPLGTRVVNDHGIILKTPVEDNRFTEVQRLVTSIVSSNPEIVRGIFMDSERRPWVLANENNPEGMPSDMSPLSDSIALWADDVSNSGEMKRFTSKELDATGSELIEFAAPVIDGDDNRLGTIRYTYTTRKLLK